MVNMSNPDRMPHSSAIAAPDSSESLVVEIPISRLAPDPFQPRTAFNERTINELAASIDQHGILQPLLVRPMQGPDSQGRFWIVAGERRYRAAQTLGMVTLPCRVRAYENMAAAVVALAENVHREDLSEIDKAEALLRIKVLTNRTWEEVAALVKLSRDYVKRLSGLTRLDVAIQDLLRAGKIPVRTAIALMPLSPRKQVEMAERVTREGLTAEQVRQNVQAMRGVPIRRSTAKREDETAVAEVSPPRATARAARLTEYTAIVREVEDWLDNVDWAPSRVSAEQKQGLERLYNAVSLLQQHLLTLRRPLREGPEADAEKLRSADPFR